MKWVDISDEKILSRTFYLGILGIICAVIPLMALYYDPGISSRINLLTGVGIGAQLLSLSMAVLLVRRRKVAKEHNEKAKRMILVLAVSLLFFFLV
ncbi:hypothetical protein [Pleomorphovibrio marinus]|uniref:hypothetical protein n=1 Tax=Pleomorphovibrio marinus TaxID=2164132 RepID=UPI000E0C3294|nr:hypothetical protein [Pleomorphovibrio marinus]